MRQLWSFRMYRLCGNWTFWCLVAPMVIISVVLSHFHTYALIPVPCVYGAKISILRDPNENEFQAFYHLCNSLSATGYLSFISSILCAFLACDDFSTQNMCLVISHGYTPKKIRHIEFAYILLVNSVLVILVRTIDVLVFWNSYQTAARWLGVGWLALVSFAHLLYSIGNFAFFFILMVYYPRHEISLILGFMLMALDTLRPESALLSFLPSIGVTSFFAEEPRGAFCFAWTIVLVFLAIMSPKWNFEK